MLTKALEVQLMLEQVVQGPGILSTVAVVNSVVRSHNRANTSMDGISEGPTALSANLNVIQF